MTLTSSQATTGRQAHRLASRHSPLEPEALWVSVSPSLSVFDRPLLKDLARYTSVAQWQYIQEADESCSIERALVLLHDYLKRRSQPVHLMGHGISGAIALLYARLYPKRVKSLTLLAVAEQPAVTWHASYYVQRHLLNCSRGCVLAKLVRQLFPVSLPYPAHYLIQALGKDLEQSPLLHSLCQIENLPQEGVEMPLLICGAVDDRVVHPAALGDWTCWMGPGDRLWHCEQGGHFFHYFQPQSIAHQMLSFWQTQPTPTLATVSSR